MALDPRGDGLTDLRIRYVIIGCHSLNRPHGGGYANLAGQDVSHSLVPDLVGVVPVLLFEGCMGFSFPRLGQVSLGLEEFVYPAIVILVERAGIGLVPFKLLAH